MNSLLLHDDDDEVGTVRVEVFNEQNLNKNKTQVKIFKVSNNTDDDDNNNEKKVPL